MKTVSATGWRRFTTRPAVIATVAAAMVWLMGAVNVISAWVGIERWRLHLLRQVLPLEVTQGTRTATALAGLLLMWLSWSLFHRKRHGWAVATALLAVSAVLHLLKGLDYEESLCAAAVLVGLLVTQREFTVRSDPRSFGNAIIMACFVLFGSLLYGILGFLLLHHSFTPEFTLAGAIQSTLALVTPFGTPSLHPLHRHAAWFVDSLVVIGFASPLLLVGILLRPVAAVLYARDSEREEVKRLTTAGGSPLAYWTLLPGLHYFFADDRRAVIAYRVAQGTAVALGDPIGHPEAVPDLLQAFAEHCRLNDWRPAFYQVTGRWIPALRELGWSGMKIGEEASVPLDGLAFTGKSWQDIRTALNRLPREGYAAVWYDLITDPAAWITPMTEVSRAWLAEHGEEKGFSLGTWENAQQYAAEQRLLVLQNPRSEPVAFLSFVPIFGECNGWSLDLMRRLPSLPSGAIEYLIATALQAFRDDGAACLSLGLSPMADITPEDAADTPELLERIRTLIYTHFSSMYNFQGLRQFKDKFHPRWEPRYLVYPSPASLPIILLALMQVHRVKKAAGRGRKSELPV